MAYRRAMDMSKLVAVFSYGGNTRTAAELIAGKEGAKLSFHQAVLSSLMAARV